MPSNPVLIALGIFAALAIGFGLVSIAGTLVDRHIRVRKNLALKKLCSEIAERDRRMA